MHRVPSPTDQTRRYQNVFDGTLNRQHSPPPAPLRWGCNSSETVEKAARTPRTEALENVPEARSWSKKAIEAIEAEVKWFDTVNKLSDMPDHEIAPELVSSRPVRHDAEQHATFIALQTHFRLSVDMTKHAGLDSKEYESDVAVWAMKTIQRRYRSTVG